MTPTSNKILLAIWFKDDNGILEGMKLLSGKKYIILINDKAPIRGPNAISSNIFPALIELSSVSPLKTEYDKNNEPTSLIYEVKGKNLFMDYINNTSNEKIIIGVEGDKYNLSFDYEFLSDLSNTNQFVIKITPSLGTIKKLSGKNYIFIVINAWGYTQAVQSSFPSF